jgi:hypothetical protein
VSAVEAYHNFRQATGEAVSEESQRADAAIAELEAENERLKERDKQVTAAMFDYNAKTRELTALKEQFKMLRMFGSNAKYDEWTAREAEKGTK